MYVNVFMRLFRYRSHHNPLSDHPSTMYFHAATRSIIKSLFLPFSFLEFDLSEEKKVKTLVSTDPYEHGCWCLYQGYCCMLVPQFYTVCIWLWVRETRSSSWCSRAHMGPSKCLAHYSKIAAKTCKQKKNRIVLHTVQKKYSKKKKNTEKKRKKPALSFCLL